MTSQQESKNKKEVTIEIKSPDNNNDNTTSNQQFNNDNAEDASRMPLTRSNIKNMELYDVSLNLVKLNPSYKIFITHTLFLSNPLLFLGIPRKAFGKIFKQHS